MGIQNKITENVFFFQFYVEKTLKRMQTNQYKEIDEHFQKRYILSVFELVTYKKLENGWKALCIGKQKDNKKTCIINVL